MLKNRMKKVLIICILVLIIITLERNYFQSMGASKLDERKIPVLLYHHILKDSENKDYRENDSVISYETFYNHMKYLHDNSITTITTKDLYEYIVNDKEIPEKSVVITFDDGYLSNGFYAYDIMKNFGQKGDIFLITSMINIHPIKFNPKYLPMLDWDTIKKTSDVFTFYSHTHDLHKHINNEPALTCLDENAISEDLKASLNYNINNLAFAYPYGAYNDTTIKSLEKNGIKIAYTVNKGYVKKSSDIYELNRFVMHPKVTMDDFKSIFDDIY